MSRRATLGRLAAATMVSSLLLWATPPAAQDGGIVITVTPSGSGALGSAFRNWKVQPVEFSAAVAVRNGNIRRQPGTNGEAIAQLKPGTRLAVTGKVRNSPYLEVTWAGRKAYVSTALVEPVVGEPVAAAEAEELRKARAPLVPPVPEHDAAPEHGAAPERNAVPNHRAVPDRSLVPEAMQEAGLKEAAARAARLRPEGSPANAEAPRTGDLVDNPVPGARAVTAAPLGPATIPALDAATLREILGQLTPAAAGIAAPPPPAAPPAPEAARALPEAAPVPAAPPAERNPFLPPG